LPGQPAIQGLLILVLPLTIVLRDVIATRRVHPATIGGVAAQLVTFGVFQWIGMSAFGGAFVAALE
jgi:hypothetical protein